ncbi:LysR substrate-binding domain-containing protein [Pseudoalteromonas denitrificans]|jgi:LysR family glycine cleavage system transcriptional activator|uniref:DNA-binding transcriptional regulator, LysR family n=1 Tax=Pseudoalteromonas denitrificans DSM 6059 TaxID=1123010 RepID=A0A1I1EWJ9_9GAMM|nr:LysR substrate-binding domain-containing protein [Pseudoalteromonas denitrificans]SFB89878.1 DNA-binding transcriptional regulator, LysR family [Pseudoalteromonas denitrificans DSM 6059]
MKNLPPLKSLQVFLSAAQNNSFKAAAENLYVTQAAVSQQIRLLESHLGCKLFERNSKQTKLNEKGKLLMPYIEHAFEQINHGVNAVKFEPNANELRISALHSVTSILLIPKISEFQEKNSNLSVQFSPNNKLDTFEALDIDIAIRRGLGDYSGLKSRKLVEDSIILISSPLIIKENKNDIDIIFDLPLLEDTSSDIQEAINDCCKQFDIKRSRLKSRLKTTDALPIIQSALAGQGIAFVSKVLVDEHLRNGNLINVLNYYFDNPRSLYLVAPAHHFSWDKVKRFETWITKLLSI